MDDDLRGPIPRITGATRAIKEGMKHLHAILLTATLLTAGCATSEVVYLKNDADQTVKCGPYTDFGNIPSANRTTHSRVRDCIADFQRQGYE